MAKPFDYSKWDNIEDSDEEDSAETTLKATIDRAWEPLNGLKNAADNLFYEAEQGDKIKSDYQKCLAYYDEVIDKAKELLSKAKESPDASEKKLNEDKARALMLPCYLNTACCFIRAKRFNDAMDRCTEALKYRVSLTPLEEIRARYLRINATFPLAQENQQQIIEYMKLDIPVNNEEYKVCMQVLQEDSNRLIALIKQHPNHHDVMYENIVSEVQEFFQDSIDKMNQSKKAAKEEAATVEEEEDDIIDMTDAAPGEVIDISDPKKKESNGTIASNIALQCTTRTETLHTAYKHLKSQQTHDAKREFHACSEICDRIVQNIKDFNAEKSNSSATTSIESVAYAECISGVIHAGYGSVLNTLQDYDEAIIEHKKTIQLLKPVLVGTYGSDLQCTSFRTSLNNLTEARDSFHREILGPYCDKKEETASFKLQATYSLWTAYDSLSDIYARTDQWMASLRICDECLEVMAPLLIMRDTERASYASPRSSPRNSNANKVEATKHTSTNAGKTLEEYLYLKKANLLIHKGHVIRRLYAIQASSSSPSPSDEDVKYTYASLDAAVHAIAQLWEEASSLFHDLNIYHKAHDILNSAARMYCEKATEGGITAFMDVNTGKDPVVDADFAERGYQLHRKAAREAQKLVESLKSQETTMEEDNVENEKLNKSIREALKRSLDSLFEAGLCGLYGGTNSYAQRAFEAAQDVKKMYTQYIAIHRQSKAIFQSEEWVSFQSTCGDLSYHLALSYMKSGKIAYTLDECDAAWDYYAIDDNANRKKKKLVLQLKILSKTLMGKSDDNSKRDIESDYAEFKSLCLGPIENGDQEVLSLKAMVKAKSPLQGARSGNITVAAQRKQEDIDRDRAIQEEERMRIRNAEIAAKIKPWYHPVKLVDNTLKFIIGKLHGDETSQIVMAWGVTLILIACVILGGMKVWEICAELLLLK